MKKPLALALALCLMAALFAGCASETAETPASEVPASEAPASEAPAEEAPTEEAPAEEAPASEAPAEEAPTEEAPAEEAPVEETPADMPELILPLTEELETITCYATFPNFMGPASACGVETNDDLACIQEAEKLTNVHVDWYSVNFMTYLEQFNVYIAGGEWTDMISGIENYSGGIIKAYEDDVIIDMRPLLEENAPHFNYYMQNDPTAFKDLLTDDGVLGVIETYNVGEMSNAGFVVNTDYFTKWGKEAPTTYDELHDYMLFAKTECGADIGMWFTDQCREDTFSYGFGVEPFACTEAAMPMYKEGDVVKCGLTADEYKNYVQTMAQWYADGILYEEFATTTWDPNNKDAANALYDGSLSVSRLNAMNMNTALANVDLTPIQKLTLEEGGYNHNDYNSASTPENIAITTQAANPELCLKWIDFWYSDLGGTMYNYGLEGISYDLVDGKPVFSDGAVNNPYGDSITNYIRTISPLGKTVGASYTEATLSTYDDKTMSFLEVWNVDTGDDANVFPTGAQLTVPESEEVTTIASDITTYATEQIPLFILGTLSFDSDWDDYCKHIESMNLERVIEIYQASYDRYLTR